MSDRQCELARGAAARAQSLAQHTSGRDERARARAESARGRGWARRSPWCALAVVLPVWLISACAPTSPLVDVSGEPAPQRTECPKELPDTVRCLGGRDRAGAYYLIGMPAQWNGVLVVHAHGGPTLGPVKQERAVQDLERWAVWPRSGYALATTTYRQGGVAVRAAAEDAERLRRIFIRHIAAPKTTVLHGQSWGGNVAAIGAETYGRLRDEGRPAYDGVLLTSGVLAGGTRAYDFRLDLRVVYQALCMNHPAAGEPAYPLWMGLPADSALTRKELAQRVDSCLGVLRKPAERTADQQQRLDTITKVIGIREDQVIAHLNWATWHFQDIVQQRTGGANPFGNIGVRYRGSADDDALNTAVARYAPDPQAVAKFSADTDPTGRIGLPVLSMHAAADPTAFVEQESAYRDTVAAAGRLDYLVQVFTSDRVHSYLTDADYVAAMGALLAWIERGEKPTAWSVAARCGAGASGEAPAKCTFLPEYRPRPLSERTPARH